MGIMRYALECPIEGKIRLIADVDVPWFNDKRLIIKRDKNGYASVIRIEGPVQPNDMISMLVEQLPNSMVHFNSAGGIQIRQELEEELKLIESTLGVYCKVSRVRWESAASIAIPETPEEEKTIQWNNFKWSPPEPDDTVDISLEDFDTILQLGHFARGLSTTMSFFREGNLDMRTRRFITAFFSFYFVLEGLYANGQFHGKRVRTEFAKSSILTKRIQDVLQFPAYNRPSRTNRTLSIDEFLGLVNKPKTVEGIIHLLVWIRGDLHHFANNPRKLTGSPFTHEKYETLARFIHDVAVSVLSDEITARFPRDDDPRRTHPQNLRRFAPGS
jgi:hypothetical protein